MTFANVVRLNSIFIFAGVLFIASPSPPRARPSSRIHWHWPIGETLQWSKKCCRERIQSADCGCCSLRGCATPCKRENRSHCQRETQLSTAIAPIMLENWSWKVEKHKKRYRWSDLMLFIVSICILVLFLLIFVIDQLLLLRRWLLFLKKKIKQVIWRVIFRSFRAYATACEAHSTCWLIRIVENGWESKIFSRTVGNRRFTSPGLVNSKELRSEFCKKMKRVERRTIVRIYDKCP